jgi:integrase
VTQLEGTDLVPYLGDRTAAMRSWRELSPEERKRRAVQAARDRDLETLWSLVEAHITLYGDRGAQTSRHTLRTYKIGVRQTLELAGAESLLSPSRDWGASFKAELAARYAPSSVNVKLAAAHALYAALRWAAATEADPFRDVKGQRDPTPAWEKRQAYSEDDLEMLLEVANPRETVLVLLGAHAGLRISEACAVRRDDLEGDKVIVRSGKGGKLGRVKLSKRLRQAIAALPVPTRKGTGSLLNIGSIRARQLMELLCARAGVPYLAVHPLRHAAGVRLYRETRDILAVQRQLRHANVNTSQTYAKGDDSSLKGVEDW